MAINIDDKEKLLSAIKDVQALNTIDLRRPENFQKAIFFGEEWPNTVNSLASKICGQFADIIKKL